MPYFMIMWQGYPDITNKVGKDVNPNQTKKIKKHTLIYAKGFKSDFCFDNCLFYD